MAFPRPDEIIAYSNIIAQDSARQHNGNVINNYSYQYTVRQRRSDESLRASQRDHVLLKAAAEGQVPRIQYLIRLGADLDFHDDFGWTALHHAAYCGFEEAVRCLLEAGSDVDARIEKCGATALHLAALKGRSNVVNELFRFRADVNALCKLGTPSHCAAWTGDLRTIDALKHASADLERCEDVYLHWVNVTLDGRRSLDKGAPTQRYVKITPLTLAVVSHCKPEVVKLLWDSNVSFFRWQLKDSRSPSKLPDYWSPALCIAARIGALDICKSLINEGADLNFNATDYCGRTALMRAAGEGYPDIMTVLIDNGANVDHASSGDTVVGAAAASGSVACLEILARNGANINQRGYRGKGRTPVQIAARYGRVAAVETLLRLGADKEIKSGIPSRNAKEYALLGMESAKANRKEEFRRVIEMLG